MSEQPSRSRGPSVPAGGMRLRRLSAAVALLGLAAAAVRASAGVSRPDRGPVLGVDAPLGFDDARLFRAARVSKRGLASGADASPGPAERAGGDPRDPRSAIRNPRNPRNLRILPVAVPIRNPQSAIRTARLPLAFEPNRGQADPRARFLAHARGYHFTLSPTELAVGLTAPGGPQTVAGRKSSRLPLSQNWERGPGGEGSPADRRPPSTVGGPPSSVAIRLAGAAPNAPMTGERRLPGHVSYLRGSDPRQWQRGLPTFSAVRVRDAYPGIDVVHYGRLAPEGTRLEHDFVVAPGADPGRIRLEVAGADSVRLTPRGDLLLQAGPARLVQQRPIAYQLVNGRRRPVPCSYRLEYGTTKDTKDTKDTKGEKGGHFRTSASFPTPVHPVRSPTPNTQHPTPPTHPHIQLAVAAYDKTKPLVIDPVLLYSTYLGGSSTDELSALALDTQGSVYVAGRTASTNYPVVGGVQGTLRAGFDVCVTRLDAAGANVLYSTYIGGNSTDEGTGIAVDLQGNAYVTGLTSSTNFPVAGGSQASNAGGQDGFVLKLNGAGDALVYSTYLGGSSTDEPHGIALDGTGAAYVTGFTLSTNFPTANALQAASGGSYDAFVTKLDPAGAARVYSTYFGAAQVDQAFGIAVDANGRAAITGTTTSTALPLAGAFQSRLLGTQDAFVARLSSTGAALEYGTYFGGAGVDVANAIAVDGGGSLYVAGHTSSVNLPKVNPVQASFRGGPFDAFIVRFHPNGTQLLYSTYLGGSGDDRALAIAIDSTGNAAVGGTTNSTNFPVLGPAQATNKGMADAWVARMGGDGTLFYSTYLGGNKDDAANGIGMDVNGTVTVAGTAASTDFPSVGAIRKPYGGGVSDGFVARLLNTVAPQIFGIAPGSGGNTGRVTATINGVAVLPGPASVRLVAAGMADISGQGTTVVDSSQIVTVFDLAGAPPGPRDVVVTLSDNTVLVLPSAFMVTAGGGPQVWADVLVRTHAVPGRVHTLYLLYGNRGSIDAPAPLLELSATGGAVLGFGGSGLGRANRLRVFAADLRGRGDVLAPGVTHALRIDYALPGGTPLGTQVTFRVGTLDVAGQPFDWNRITAAVPPGVDEALWTGWVTHARALMGDTWDGVMTALRGLVAKPGGAAPDMTDLDELLLYAVAQYGTPPSGGAFGPRTRPLGTRRPVGPRDAFTPSQVLVGTFPANAGFDPSKPTFILTHGYGGLPADPGAFQPGVRAVRWWNLARAIKTAIPASNVLLIDWSAGARDQLGGTVPFPALDAPNVPIAADGAAQRLAQVPLNLANTTLIGEGLGAYVDCELARRLGSVAHLLLLNPATGLNGYVPGGTGAAPPYPTTALPDFRKAAGLSWAFESESLFDTWVDLADRHVWLQAPGVNDPRSESTYGVEWLANQVAAGDTTVLLMTRNLADRATFWDARVAPDGTFGTVDAPTIVPHVLPDPLFPAAVPLASALVTTAGSVDPREKVGSQGAGDSHFVAGSEPFRYAVFFANDGSSPVREVTVTDVLDGAVLDPGSLSLGPIAFGSSQVTPPPGVRAWNALVDLRPGRPVQVKVTAGYEPASGAITWKLSSLDPATGQPPADPQQGFLPPNAAPPAGEGAVLFTLRPRAPLPTGTTVQNRATVAFDGGGAETPAWTNTLDNDPPASAVQGLPASPTAAQFTVSWSGTDVGAGIRDFTIWVSDNSGPFVPWQKTTTATSATYTGQAGHTYAFYSVARDQAGNFEAPPPAPDATTALVAPTAPEGLQADAPGTTSVPLRWTDTSGNETGFRIEARTGSAAFAEKGTVGPNTTTFTVQNLLPNTAYDFRVIATGAFGDSPPSNVVTATTQGVPVPSAPSNLAATVASAVTINLTWQDKSDNEKGFRLERKSGMGGFAAVKTLNPGTTSTTDTPLSPSTAYTYRVIAFNDAGDSPPSNEFTATTLLGVKSVAVKPTSVKGGKSVTITITLSARTTQTTPVSLLSSLPAALKLPPTATVPRGRSSVIIKVTAKKVTATKNVKVTASLNGSAAQATLKVTR